MNTFVADSEDNQARMQQAVAAQLRDRDAGLMQYFYRSDVVYQRELETVFFKSWLWAGHVSQIPNTGDFFLYEIAEESVIVARGNDGSLRAARHMDDATPGFRKEDLGLKQVRVAVRFGMIFINFDPDAFDFN